MLSFIILWLSIERGEGLTIRSGDLFWFCSGSPELCDGELHWEATKEASFASEPAVWGPFCFALFLLDFLVEPDPFFGDMLSGCVQRKEGVFG